MLLNRIWGLQTSMTNYFNPQQKLVSKVRNGAKVTKKYDTATTPQQRAQNHPAVAADAKAELARAYEALNPAAVQRQIQALTAELLTVTTAKATARNRPAVNAPSTRAIPGEATKTRTRAS